MPNIYVEYTSTTKEGLDGVEYLEGQLLALRDADECYYDLGGKRRCITGVRRIDALPDTGNSNLLYVIDNTDDPSKPEIYLWNDSTQEFYLANNLGVNTYPTDDEGSVYFTGTTEAEASRGDLVKILGIFANPKTGELTAKEFLGNATSSTKAKQDQKGQVIDKTYIKELSIEGTALTITKGDGTSSTVHLKIADTNVSSTYHKLDVDDKEPEGYKGSVASELHRYAQQLQKVTSALKWTAAE